MKLRPFGCDCPKGCFGAKGKRTSSKADTWIKEGKGTGSGAEYQLWLKIQDVPSLGQFYFLNTFSNQIRNLELEH